MNAVDPSKAVNIEDLRRLARRRLPNVVFDYLDCGSDGQFTLRENRRAFDDIMFRPRQAVSVGACDLRTKVLGREISFPAMLAPVGYLRLMHPGGSVAAARAAGAFGTGAALSTISGHTLENFRAATTGPAWYQLYLIGGREAGEGAIERARRAGFDALIITVDTAVSGMRERDPRNGMKQLLGSSTLAKIPFLGQFFAHPGWVFSLLRDGGVPKLANVTLPGQGPMPLMDIGAALADTVVTWNDLQWIRKAWSGPIVVKGVLSAEDAKRAVDEGAAAIVVSNHGARQLDYVPASLQVLPEIVKAVRGQVEVIMDSGIRRGTDIVKALCLGAEAVLIGRAYAYGLAAGGQAGVTRALTILRDDVERTLRLLGCKSVADLDPTYIEAASRFPARSEGSAALTDRSALAV
ncbi:alpha-hydroxy-acid oxidizing protein [bacterium]|nr:MAG: alpha-hydroxy-acid oxidizing protein [bacterium]